MFFMPILWIVILGLIIWMVMATLHRPGQMHNAANKPESPMDILKRRYAQGEIDKKEYEVKKKDLA